MAAALVFIDVVDKSNGEVSFTLGDEDQTVVNDLAIILEVKVVDPETAEYTTIDLVVPRSVGHHLIRGLLTAAQYDHLGTFDPDDYRD